MRIGKKIFSELYNCICFLGRNFISPEFLKVSIPVLFIWELLPDMNIISPNLLPPVSNIFSTMVEMFLNGQLLIHIFYSLGTFMIGFLIAVITAVPIGIIMGWNFIIRKHTLPFFQILAPIPPTAWVPLSIIFLGIGLPMKIFLIFLGAFYPILFNTYQAIKDTNPRYLSSARALGASECTLITHVYLWNSLGAIIMSIRTGIIFGLIMLTAAEIYGGRSGIGFLLVNAKEFFLVPEMFVCMGILGAIGWFLSEVLKFIEYRLNRWKFGTEEQ